MDKKTSALGNISSFMSKQPAVRRATGHPEFLQPLIDKEFPLGEPAVLEVRVGGPGPVTIQWYHNSQPVRESIEKDIRLLQKGFYNFTIFDKNITRLSAKDKLEVRSIRDQ